MGDIRKEIASAITGHNLKSDDVALTALDRVSALAFATLRHKDPFGACLLHLKWANDATVYGTARSLLAHKLDRKLSLALRRSVAGLVLDEWLYDVCPSCVGRGRQIIEGTPHAPNDCEVCKGTGKREPRKEERAAGIGVALKQYPKYAPVFEAALKIIEHSDNATAAECRAQLGRWGWNG